MTPNQGLLSMNCGLFWVTVACNLGYLASSAVLALRDRSSRPPQGNTKRPITVSGAASTNSSNAQQQWPINKSLRVPPPPPLLPFLSAPQHQAQLQVSSSETGLPPIHPPLSIQKVRATIKPSWTIAGFVGAPLSRGPQGP